MDARLKSTNRVRLKGHVQPHDVVTCVISLEPIS